MCLRKEVLFLLWFVSSSVLEVFVGRSDGAHPLDSLSELEVNDFSCCLKIKHVVCEYSLEQ